MVCPQFSGQASRVDGAHLVNAQEVGAGVWGGTLDGLPTFYLDLTRLPLQPATLALLMVPKGPRERELVEFVVTHFQEYPQHVRFLRELHVQTLREVLRMRQLTPEQIGLDYQALLDLIGEERALDLIGEERVIELLGGERLVEDIFRQKGEDWLWLRTLLERLTKQPSPAAGAPPPAPPGP